jgi:hypothetical protein
MTYMRANAVQSHSNVAIVAADHLFSRSGPRSLERGPIFYVFELCLIGYPLKFVIDRCENGQVDRR